MNYESPKNNLNKYGLALHTTSPQLGISINNFVGNLRYQTWDLDRDLSNELHQCLAEFIQPQNWSDLAFIAVAKGPGSFTSTRIGVVTCRTLAQQLAIPLFAISTLATVAWSKKDNIATGQLVAVEMEARRGQLFVGIYEILADVSGLIFHLNETVMTRENWQKYLGNLTRSYQILPTPVNLGVTATSLLELAYLDWQQGKRPDWSEALPFYGQHPVEL